VPANSELVPAVPWPGVPRWDAPWWGVLSSATAPVLLIGGWTIAAGLQPDHFDPVTGTISALAAHGAADRWVMTLALAALGACYVVTGLALRAAARPGRLLLMAGGVATVVVAANPLPPAGGSSLPHGLAAGVAFVALAIWPAGAWRRPSPVPVGPVPAQPVPASPVPAVLRPAVAAGAVLILAGLLTWFAVELWGGGGQVGLSERVLAGAESIWPLVVVLLACWQLSRARRVCRARQTAAPGSAR
jgi:Protein of unknown function (DUF998)